MKRMLIASSVLALASFMVAGSASAQVCVVNGVAATISADTAWPAGVAGCAAGDDVVMVGRQFVVDDATLSISPGTVVRGYPRLGPPDDGMGTLTTVGAPGALIVTKAGRIESDGDPGAPVIFTTAAMDNDTDNIPDDLNNDGFLDPYPGFTAACTCGNQPAAFGTTSCEGADAELGTGDDTLGTCVLSGAPSFYDDAPETSPLAPLSPAGDQNVALWGGVVVLGGAPTNLGTAAGVGTKKGTVEGLTVPGEPTEFATYGGDDPLDSSGFIEFTSIRHAGDELNDGNELNGLTLAGVGLGTRVEFSEVYANFDDGLEIFGGNVSTNNFAVYFAGDDQFDLDQGHVAAHQFWFTYLPFFNQYNGADTDELEFGSGSGDKAGEWDGDDATETTPNVTLCGDISKSTIGTPGLAPCPVQSTYVYNLTAISNDLTAINEGGSLTPVTADYDPTAALCDGDPTVDSGEPDCCNVSDGAMVPTFTEECTAANNEGIEMRNGFAGELRNSIVVNTGSRQGYDVSGGGATGYTTGQNICSHNGDAEGSLSPVGYGNLVRVTSTTIADSLDLPGGPGDAAGPNAGPGSQACVGDESDAIVNGDSLALDILGLASTARSCLDDGSGNADFYVDGSSTPGPGWGGLVSEDGTFDPTGGASGKLPSKGNSFNPRPGSLVPFCHSVASDVEHPVADRAAGVRGAFGTASGEPVLWTSPWSVLNIADVLAD